MSMEISTDRYSSSDTPLAAWLCTLGFDIVSIDNISFPSRYIFEDSRALQDAVRQWNMLEGDADICYRFHRNYRDLLHKIHHKINKLPVSPRGSEGG